MSPARLRYLGISMIYVSSTADLYIAGLGNSVVLPIVLAVLSLLSGLLMFLARHSLANLAGAGPLVAPEAPTATPEPVRPSAPEAACSPAACWVARLGATPLPRRKATMMRLTLNA